MLFILLCTFILCPLLFLYLCYYIQLFPRLNNIIYAIKLSLSTDEQVYLTLFQSKRTYFHTIIITFKSWMILFIPFQYNLINNNNNTNYTKLFNLNNNNGNGSSPFNSCKNNNNLLL